jgi:hypothetical protein
MHKLRRRFTRLLGSLAWIGLAMTGSPAAFAGVPPKDALQSVRVLYLQGMPPSEASNQLRVSIGIAAFSTFQEPAAIVLRDLPHQVERSEALLREQGAVAHSVEPHPPIVLLRPPEAPLLERRLRFADFDQAKKALLVLRVIYGVKEVTTEGDSELVVRDLEVILEAGQALCRELGLLAVATP